MPAQAGIQAGPAIEKYRVLSDNLFFFKIPRHNSRQLNENEKDLPLMNLGYTLVN